jgi:hypothetical protein
MEYDQRLVGDWLRSIAKHVYRTDRAKKRRPLKERRKNEKVQRGTGNGVDV